MTSPCGRWDRGWLAVVEEYSQRKLTKDSDKLPALSGLASFIANHTNDEYYAGLWRDHILEDLHWRVYVREEVRITCTHDNPVYGRTLCSVVAPTTYRAPSWSWASLDSHIKFIPLDFSRIIADFIIAHTTPAEEDPFAAVTDGWIKLLVGDFVFTLMLFLLILFKGPARRDPQGRSETAS
jgi:hypothetical protein